MSLDRIVDVGICDRVLLEYIRLKEGKCVSSNPFSGCHIQAYFVQGLPIISQYDAISDDEDDGIEYNNNWAGMDSCLD